ncbi:helix-turn-helix transcriptional regulator [Nonomuraea sp. NPDC049758]|uniref:helix-turn-helix transcriptional regulator n=1 Tax=Nonomuraea sp. NPDC049758 TaxID=3154360 RepID=UPI003422D99D
MSPSHPTRAALTPPPATPRWRRAVAPATAAAVALSALGRYEQALRDLAAVTVVFAAPDLIEAAVRAEAPDRAADAYARFAAWARAADRPWARAVALRCRGLLSPAQEAGEHYARDRPAPAGRPAVRTRPRVAAVRRVVAPRAAQGRGASAAAVGTGDLQPARRRAVGRACPCRAARHRDSAPAARPADALAALTPQELQIVRLAAAGVSNRDIAAQLFLSHRTVEYHLYKAYPKLGIGSRQELASLV